MACLPQAKEQLKGADVIFADVRQLDHVASHFPRALCVCEPEHGLMPVHSACLTLVSGLTVTVSAGQARVPAICAAMLTEMQAGTGM